MKPKMIWANLAVANLERTEKFYTELGFNCPFFPKKCHRKQLEKYEIWRSSKF